MERNSADCKDSGSSISPFKWTSTSQNESSSEEEARARREKNEICNHIAKMKRKNSICNRKARKKKEEKEEKRISGRESRTRRQGRGEGDTLRPISPQITSMLQRLL